MQKNNPSLNNIFLITLSGFPYLEDGIYAILVSCNKKLKKELISSELNIDSISNSLANSRHLDIDMKNIVQQVKISGIDHIRLTTNSNFMDNKNISTGIQNENYISIPLNKIAKESGGTIIEFPITCNREGSLECIENVEVYISNNVNK